MKDNLIFKKHPYDFSILVTFSTSSIKCTILGKGYRGRVKITV